MSERRSLILILTTSIKADAILLIFVALTPVYDRVRSPHIREIAPIETADLAEPAEAPRSTASVNALDECAREPPIPSAHETKRRERAGDGRMDE
ncbi:hypothetical protein [Chamaesiphon sp. VAR_48_metabat_403]|uniref:hypothetical protein n=1 Tax=Chamaesiphon sp. VAR_48_metabat_403 TaxID=2964700 RepID=UPI00286EAC08|nr:hypothetical protein [Chamaesiphon sp. VAR_48_metabat_403]